MAKDCSYEYSLCLAVRCNVCARCSSRTVEFANDINYCRVGQVFFVFIGQTGIADVGQRALNVLVFNLHVEMHGLVVLEIVVEPVFRLVSRQRRKETVLHYLALPGKVVVPAEGGCRHASHTIVGGNAGKDCFVGMQRDIGFHNGVAIRICQDDIIHSCCQLTLLFRVLNLAFAEGIAAVVAEGEIARVAGTVGYESHVDSIRPVVLEGPLHLEIVAAHNVGRRGVDDVPPYADIAREAAHRVFFLHTCEIVDAVVGRYLHAVALQPCAVHIVALHLEIGIEILNNAVRCADHDAARAVLHGYRVRGVQGGVVLVHILIHDVWHSGSARLEVAGERIEVGVEEHGRLHVACSAEGSVEVVVEGVGLVAGVGAVDVARHIDGEIGALCQGCRGIPVAFQDGHLWAVVIVDLLHFESRHAARILRGQHATRAVVHGCNDQRTHSRHHLYPYGAARVVIVRVVAIALAFILEDMVFSASAVNLIAGVGIVGIVVVGTAVCPYRYLEVDAVSSTHVDRVVSAYLKVVVGRRCHAANKDEKQQRRYSSHQSVCLVGFLHFFYNLLFCVNY